MSNLFQRLAGRAQSPSESLAPRRPYLFEQGGRLGDGATAGDDLHRQRPGPASRIEPPGGPERLTAKEDARTTDPPDRSRAAASAQSRPPKGPSATLAGAEGSLEPASRIQPRPQLEPERATKRPSAASPESAGTAQAPDPPQTERSHPLQPKRAEPRAEAPAVESTSQPPVERPALSPREASLRPEDRPEGRHSDRPPREWIPEPLVPAAARDRQGSDSGDPSEGSAAAGSGRRPGRSLAPKTASPQGESSRAEAPKTETVVRVTIGSLEVRAVTPQTKPEGPTPRPLAKPRTSLADYQKRRGGRG